MKKPRWGERGIVTSPRRSSSTQPLPAHHFRGLRHRLPHSTRQRETRPDRLAEFPNRSFFAPDMDALAYPRINIFIRKRESYSVDFFVRTSNDDLRPDFQLVRYGRIKVNFHFGCLDGNDQSISCTTIEHIQMFS